MTESIPYPDIDNGEPTPTKIFHTIIGDLTNRRGFRQAYDGVDDEIRKEIEDELTKKIEATLSNPSIPQNEKAVAVVGEAMKDLSNRRGIRQGFFDKLFFDDEQVKDYVQQHPGTEVTEDESREGIARQLTVKIEPFIAPSTS